MRRTRLIPIIIFLIAVVLSAWISPALGVERSVFAQHEPLSVLPRGENSNTQVASVQETISLLLLLEEDNQIFLPIVKR